MHNIFASLLALAIIGIALLALLYPLLKLCFQPQWQKFLHRNRNCRLVIE